MDTTSLTTHHVRRDGLEELVQIRMRIKILAEPVTYSSDYVSIK